MPTERYLRGRGAQINPANPFHQHVYDEDPLLFDPDRETGLRTEYIEVYPKSILNKVDSPDIGPAWSMNPYQGCEHGCVYCYARNTHTYWGYSAGLEFEQKILVKRSAPKILEETIQKKSWKAMPIMLAGNTDCYQPAEQRFQITRQLLEVCWKYRHPVGIITKSSLVLRDLDLLRQLAAHRLVNVSVSVTTLQEELRRFLEPRTASVRRRLQTIRELSENGVPVNGMLAPIIPGLNEHEVLEMAKTVAAHGARSIGYTMVRLNGDVARIFEDGLRKTYPDRADKILNKIRECHGGRLSDSRFGTRMTGEGRIAEIIAQQVKMARKRYFEENGKAEYDLTLHERYKTAQLKLF